MSAYSAWGWRIPVRVRKICREQILTAEQGDAGPKGEAQDVLSTPRRDKTLRPKVVFEFPRSKSLDPDFRQDDNSSSLNTKPYTSNTPLILLLSFELINTTDHKITKYLK